MAANTLMLLGLLLSYPPLYHQARRDLTTTSDDQQHHHRQQQQQQQPHIYSRKEAGGPGHGRAGLPAKGAFRSRGRHLCQWKATGGSGGGGAGGGEVTVRVVCAARQQRRSYWCEYRAKPSRCDAYGHKAARYWKQVIRRLKHKANACEGRKMLKAGVCRHAPKKAHLTLAYRSRKPPQRGNHRPPPPQGAGRGLPGAPGRPQVHLPPPPHPPPPHSVAVNSAEAHTPPGRKTASAAANRNPLGGGGIGGGVGGGVGGGGGGGGGGVGPHRVKVAHKAGLGPVQNAATGGKQQQQQAAKAERDSLVDKGGEEVEAKEQWSAEQVAEEYCAEGWTSLCSFLVGAWQG
ncbi:uncharacterized protein LOC116956345 [Petromyzon marinus]|uniref:uncharacterized protein LOC116956345 n=1 Tax=Petromyzon marinus TaxID=7757 RepID=UPI003F72AE0D